MQSGWERWLVAALAVGVVAAGGAWILRPVDPVVPPATAPAPAGLASVPAPVMARPAPAVPAALLAADAPPVAELVRQLLATGEPQGAYTAYQLVSVCARFNDGHDLAMRDAGTGSNRGLATHERQHVGSLCGALTERERQARFDHLAAAIKGGVPGAALAYASEGPFGDPSALETRPGDPLVKEWKATATAQLTQAAEAGDPVALHAWGVQKLLGSGLADKEPELGYGYLLATGFIQADLLGPNAAAAQSYADGSALMSAMAAAAGLTPAQRAAAMLAARRIADRVKREREAATPS